MDEITYMNKLGDIKQIIAKRIIKVTNNTPIMRSRLRKWENTEKMFCFAPASVESIPDRWKFVNQLNIDVHVLAYTISDSSIQKSFGLGGIRTHVRHLQT